MAVGKALRAVSCQGVVSWLSKWGVGELCKMYVKILFNYKVSIFLG